MNKLRTFSRYSTSAVSLLGKAIQLGRKQRKWSAQELAQRAGIARGTLIKIEKGDMACEIGLVFELAALVGVRLFNEDQAGLGAEISRMEDKLALLPKSIRSTPPVAHDDF